jgi:aspartate aminotransferase
VECISGDGTFYLFPSMQKLINNLGLKNDLELTSHLIDKAGVALVPGSAFGLEGHVRLSFATSDDVLKEALKRIASVA